MASPLSDPSTTRVVGVWWWWGRMLTEHTNCTELYTTARIVLGIYLFVFIGVHVGALEFEMRGPICIIGTKLSEPRGSTPMGRLLNRNFLQKVRRDS